MTRIGWLLVVSSTSVIAVAACGAFSGESDPAPCAGGACAPAADASSPGSDAGADASTVACAAKVPGADFEGCLCEVAGSVSACFHGKTGPTSACKASGTQTCVAQPNSERRYGPCVGGDVPAATDTCFDGIDNDCNGIIDDGCLCSPGRDLCKDANGGLLPDPSAYWVPATVQPGQVAQLIVVTSSSQISNDTIGLNRENDGYCAGGGLAKPCATAGDGCPGWTAGRFEVPVTIGGGLFPMKTLPSTYKMHVSLHRDTGGCGGTPIVTSGPITVVP